MPVGQGAVSQSIKDPQDKPGCGSQQEADKIQTPCSLPDPSEEVEQDEAGMKDRKEDVEKFHHPKSIAIRKTYGSNILLTSCAFTESFSISGRSNFYQLSCI